MNEELGIDIELCIKYEDTTELPYSLFRGVLDAVSETVFKSEKEDLKAILAEFPDIPKVAIDAAHHRLAKHKHSSILVKKLSEGSLLITVSVAGLAIWLLNQTVGETVKEAWLDSEGHKKLKQFLLTRLTGKKKSVAEKTTKKIENVVPSRTSISYDEPSDATKLGNGSCVIRIEVKVEVFQKDYPPNRKDTF